MSDEQLTDLLVRAGERTAVGAPPLAAITAGGRRRRRTRMGGGAVAVVAILAAATAITTTVGAGPTTQAQAPVATSAPADSESEPPTADITAPPGTRLVGAGPVAVAVPDSWATNALQCGTPQRDTVVIDQGVIDACAIARPGGVDSVEIVEGEVRFDFEAQSEVQVDGVSAERTATTCVDGMLGAGAVCAVTINFPTLGVWVRAESPTKGAAQRTLDGVRVVDSAVGVPGYQGYSSDFQARGGERYVEALTASGLVAQIETESVPGLPAGFIRDVSPAPGAVLAPGSTVTVTVVAEPNGPSEELRVDVNTDRDGVAASDPEIRRGATLEVRVGDRIWAYAFGRRERTLAGTLDGAALAVDDWREGPNYPHSWIAVAPGTTTVTLTITVDGRPVELGTVTVRVT